MARRDNIIEGLRTQIFENWYFLHPNQNESWVVVTYHKYKHEALLIEDCSGVRKILLVSGPHIFAENALYELLEKTGEMVDKSLCDKRDERGRLFADQ